MRNKISILKDKLIAELEAYFGTDAKRISHAKRVLFFAEELLKEERADAHIVIPASILHDVGIKVAEEKYGSSAGNLQEKESPSIAREILERVEFKEEHIKEICDIIGHHHSPGVIDTMNFKILYDADWLVNFKDEVDTGDTANVRRLIERIFLTGAGRKMAKKMYIYEEE